MNTSSNVTKLYRTVVEDVINNVKEAFLDEGVDEQVLQELRQLWDSKLAASKALDPVPQDDPSVIPPGSMVMLPQPITTSAHQGASAPVTQIQSNTQFQPTNAAQTATLALPSGLFQHQLAAIGAGGQIQNITVQQTGNGQFITLAQFQQQPQQQTQQPQQHISQPVTSQVLQAPQQQQTVRLPIQSSQPQQHAQLMAAGQTLQPSQTTMPAQTQGMQSLIQIDGTGDTSSSDEDDFDDDDKDEEEKEEDNEDEDQGEEEEPLNSEDDVSEEDPNELFDTENVVVCQYDKVNRHKNKWKFYLKDGIMNLNGRDYVFQKASGDSEW